MKTKIKQPSDIRDVTARQHPFSYAHVIGFEKRLWYFFRQNLKEGAAAMYFMNGSSHTIEMFMPILITHNKIYRQNKIRTSLWIISQEKTLLDRGIENDKKNKNTFRYPEKFIKKLRHYKRAFGKNVYFSVAENLS